MSSQYSINAGQPRVPVGLAQNPDGVPFQCGTCDFFQNGVCHNSDQRLTGQQVQPVWCCNFYTHDGMQTIIK